MNANRLLRLLSLAGVFGAVLLLAGLARLHGQPPDARGQWNKIYSDPAFPYKTERNDFLAEVIKGRTPGKALDLGTGRGRNALYLASQGWQVTGVDISDDAIRTATAEAARAGLTVTFLRQDFDAFDVGQGQWDLIAGIYMGDLVTTQAARLITGLKPGGLLVVENFARDINQPARVGGAPLGYSANQLLDVFKDLRVRRYEDTTAIADWGRQSATVPVVRFVGEKLGEKSGEPSR